MLLLSLKLPRNSENTLWAITFQWSVLHTWGQRLWTTFLMLCSGILHLPFFCHVPHMSCVSLSLSKVFWYFHFFFFKICQLFKLYHWNYKLHIDLKPIFVSSLWCTLGGGGWWWLKKAVTRVVQNPTVSSHPPLYMSHPAFQSDTCALCSLSQ